MTDPDATDPGGAFARDVARCPTLALRPDRRLPVPPPSPFTRSR